MISKTKIQERIKNKKNIVLVKTIILAKKNNHLELARQLSSSTRKQLKINLEFLKKIENNNILIPGKILGLGEINKKISISALNFSSSAKEKLKKAGCEFKTIKEELEKNPSLKGVKIINGKDNN